MRNPKELFESIVNLSKKALSSENVEEVVELAQPVESVEPEVKREEIDVKKEDSVVEPPIVAPVEQPVAVSKSEFDSAIAEIKEMYTKVLESISPSQPQEVPEALSEELTEEEVIEEVSLKEVVSEEVVLEEVQLKEEKVEDGLIHDPESLIEKRETFLYSQNRVQSTEDVVFKSLFNNKN